MRQQRRMPLVIRCDKQREANAKARGSISSLRVLVVGRVGRQGSISRWGAGGNLEAGSGTAQAQADTGTGTAAQHNCQPSRIEKEAPKKARNMRHPLENAVERGVGEAAASGCEWRLLGCVRYLAVPATGGPRYLHWVWSCSRFACNWCS